MSPILCFLYIPFNFQGRGQRLSGNNIMESILEQATRGNDMICFMEIQYVLLLSLDEEGMTMTMTRIPLLQNVA